MKIEEYGKVIRGIEMPERMEKEILSNLKRAERMENAGKRSIGKAHGTVLRRAAVIVGILCVAGAVSLPVKALVESVLRERMEQVPQQEMEELKENLEKQTADGDGFSRTFTQEEEERMYELEKQYRQGLFPEGELLQVESADMAVEDTLCYITETSEYILPDRELTDEEILQYLDFQEKQKYALKENTGEVKAEASVPKELGEVIGEDKAAEIGENWMNVLFQEDISGMDSNSYLYTTEEAASMPEDSKYPNFYMVYFGTLHNHYYFHIDAETGILAEVDHSEAGETKSLTAEEAETFLKETRAKAEEILLEKIGIEGGWKEVYGCYMVEDGSVPQGSIALHFVKEDGSGYIIGLESDKKTLWDYKAVIEEDYLEAKQKQSERYANMEFVVVEM